MPPVCPPGFAPTTWKAPPPLDQDEIDEGTKRVKKLEAEVEKLQESTSSMQHGGRCYPCSGACMGRRKSSKHNHTNSLCRWVEEEYEWERNGQWEAKQHDDERKMWYVMEEVQKMFRTMHQSKENVKSFPAVRNMDTDVFVFENEGQQSRVAAIEKAKKLHAWKEDPSREQRWGQDGRRWTGYEGSPNMLDYGGSGIN